MICIYPFLAMIAGIGAAGLISAGRRSRLKASLALLLLGAQFIVTAWAHPDYLAYFNPLAGSQPEKIVVNSDIDWGQDLKRLHTYVTENHIQNIKIQYHGSWGIDFGRMGFSGYGALTPYKKEKGWIAISVTSLALGTRKKPFDQFDWLKAYKPVRKSAIPSSYIIFLTSSDSTNMTHQY